MTKSEYNKLVYDMRRKNGICVTCGKQDAYTILGRCRCYECTEKQKKAVNDKYKNDYEYRTKVRSINKEWTDQHKADGVCIYCGKRDAKEDHVYCESCLAKKRYMFHANKPYKLERSQTGLCYRCQKDVPMQGKKVCEKCYAYLFENMKKARLKQDNSKHIWKAYNEIDFQK